MRKGTVFVFSTKSIYNNGLAKKLEVVYFFSWELANCHCLFI